MALITHLYGVYRIDYGGSVKMSDATPSEVIQRILIVKKSINTFKIALVDPRLRFNLKEKARLSGLIDEFKEEIEDLWDYYLGKVRFFTKSNSST